MKSYNFYNLVTGWSVFVISSIVYLLTIESTASFWDCGEFITTAYKMQVGHPPGAPVFMIFGRFFTLFAGNPANVAVAMNVMSALASSFTILFLFWSITHLAKKIIISDWKNWGNIDFDLDYIFESDQNRYRLINSNATLIVKKK